MEIRNNDFKLQLKDGSIKEFEKVVLSSGICDLFMPMGFVRLKTENWFLITAVGIQLCDSVISMRQKKLLKFWKKHCC